jgi:hypothetical protein
MLGRELDAAMELIGEVFSVGADEVKRMIKERMEGRGMIKGRKRAQGDATQAGDEKQASIAKKSPRPSRKRKKARELDDEDLEV